MINPMPLEDVVGSMLTTYHSEFYGISNLIGLKLREQTSHGVRQDLREFGGAYHCSYIDGYDRCIPLSMVSTTGISTTTQRRSQ